MIQFEDSWNSSMGEIPSGINSIEERRRKYLQENNSKKVKERRLVEYVIFSYERGLISWAIISADETLSTMRNREGSGSGHKNR